MSFQQREDWHGFTATKGKKKRCFVTGLDSCRQKNQTVGLHSIAINRMLLLLLLFVCLFVCLFLFLFLIGRALEVYQ